MPENFEENAIGAIALLLAHLQISRDVLNKRGPNLYKLILNFARFKSSEIINNARAVATIPNNITHFRRYKAKLTPTRTNAFVSRN